MSENNKDEIIEEHQTEDEQEGEMEVVKASNTEVIAKPKNVVDLANKAIASNISSEEERKWIEDNVIGEFED